MGAYDHSFSPVETGKYILRMLQNDWPLNIAVIHAAVEHGAEQVDEIADLLAEENPNYSDNRSLFPALRRAIKRAEKIASGGPRETRRRQSSLRRSSP